MLYGIARDVLPILEKRIDPSDWSIRSIPAAYPQFDGTLPHRDSEKAGGSSVCGEPAVETWALDRITVDSHPEIKERDFFLDGLFPRSSSRFSSDWQRL